MFEVHHLLAEHGMSGVSYRWECICGQLGKGSWLVAGHFESAPALSVYVIMLFENDGIESPLCRITVGYV